MAAPKNKVKEKRKYTTVTKEFILSGKDWKLNLPMDKDVALAIIDERDKNPGGGEFVKIVMNRLRQAYKIKIK